MKYLAKNYILWLLAIILVLSIVYYVLPSKPVKETIVASRLASMAAILNDNKLSDDVKISIIKEYDMGDSTVDAILNPTTGKTDTTTKVVLLKSLLDKVVSFPSTSDSSDN